MNERDLQAHRRAARQLKASTARLPTGLFRRLASFSEAQRIAIENARPTAQGFATVAETIRRTTLAIAKTANDPAVRDTFAHIGRALRDLREALPPNWPIDVDFERVIELSDAGIPTVWLPNANLLEKLLGLEDLDARMSLLLDCTDELGADARAALSQVTHPTLGPQLPLATSAIDAWMDGHGRAAQALAVAIIETVALNHLAGDFKSPDKKVGWGSTVIDLDDPDDQLAVAELRTTVAVAPLATFYTHWFPTSNAPMPTQLSRHAASHQAHVDHFTDSNALLSIILMASILRATDELLRAADAVNARAGDIGDATTT